MFTSVFGIISFFLLPANLAKMPFLSSEEKTIYADVLAADWSGDDDHEVFSWSEVLSAFVDAPHILLTCVPLFMNGFMVSLVG